MGSMTMGMQRVLLLCPEEAVGRASRCAGVEQADSASVTCRDAAGVFNEILGQGQTSRLTIQPPPIAARKPQSERPALLTRVCSADKKPSLPVQLADTWHHDPLLTVLQSRSIGNGHGELDTNQGVAA